MIAGHCEFPAEDRCDAERLRRRGSAMNSRQVRSGASGRLSLQVIRHASTTM
jgi:hypothetical protein